MRLSCVCRAQQVNDCNQSWEKARAESVEHESCTLESADLAMNALSAHENRAPRTFQATSTRSSRFETRTIDRSLFGDAWPFRGSVAIDSTKPIFGSLVQQCQETAVPLAALQESQSYHCAYADRR